MFATISAMALPQGLEDALDSLDVALANRTEYKAVADNPQMERLINSGNRHWHDGDYALALADWNDAIDLAADYSEQLSRVSRYIANYYARYEDKDDDRLYYLCLSAISDVMLGAKQSDALAEVGKAMIKRSDNKRAEAYILYSSQTATAETSALSALYRKGKTTHATHLLILAIVIALMAITLGLSAYVYYRQKQTIASLVAEKDAYHSNNNSQEAIIKQLLSLSESVMESSDDFMRLASRKIKAGQVQDLLKSIESGKYQQDRTENFATAFDEYFHLIFPDFKSQVNELFQADKRIDIAEGPQLNAELRILALLRLGIDEPTKLNRFLGLSINTIYTYRNKAKSRALDRENFEENIKKIGIKY
jgi:hypothetical protein